MHLKKESRILILSRIENSITGVVLRGILGIENSIVFDDCHALQRFLSSKKGLAGEINYIIYFEDICKEFLSRDHRVISVDDINSDEIRNIVIETYRIINIAKLRFLRMKIVEGGIAKQSK